MIRVTTHRDDFAVRAYVWSGPNMVYSLNVHPTGHLHVFAVVETSFAGRGIHRLTDESALEVVKAIFGPLDFSRRPVEVAA